MVRNRLKELGVTDEDNTRKKIDFNQFISGSNDDYTNVFKPPASTVRREVPSPSMDDSSDGQSIGGLNDLRLWPSGGDDDDPDDEHKNGTQINISNRRRGRYEMMIARSSGWRTRGISSSVCLWTRI